MKKNPRKSTQPRAPRRPTSPSAAPHADLHLRMLLTHLNGFDWDDIGPERVNEFDRLARQTLQRLTDSKSPDFIEALMDRFETETPSDTLTGAVSALKNMRRAFGDSLPNHPQQLTIDGPSGFDLLAALTDDAFHLGAAVMYRLLKGGVQ